MWGAAVGLAAGRVRPGFRRRTVCILGALSAPLCGIGLSLGRFYTSPMVFAFDPFFGYFAGPLYDTVIDAFWTLATYRAGTLLTLLGARLRAPRSSTNACNFRAFVAAVGSRAWACRRRSAAQP